MSDDSDVNSVDASVSLPTLSTNVMEQENIDRAHMDTHAERLEYVESQLADVKSTTEALNEPLKRLMLKLDGGESPMLLYDSPGDWRASYKPSASNRTSQSYQTFTPYGVQWRSHESQGILEFS
jgi:hypothetical protein